MTVHYYGFHVADYVEDARHLSLLEDLAYRRMLDLYYQQEGPLLGDAAAIARRIGMRDHAAEVEAVLDDFFTESPKGWRQDRCDQEVAEYRKTCKRNRDNAKKGGRPKASDAQATGNPLGLSPDTSRIPPNPSTQPQSPTPTPVQENPRGEEGGVSLEVAGGGDGGQSDEQPSLFAELCRTTIRSKSKNRRVALSRLACTLDSQGMKPQELRSLWKRACQESAKEPGGLLLHWIENGWREKVRQ